MNQYCPTLGCFLGAQFDEGADNNAAWVAIKVYRDGNVIDLGRFASEEDAEAAAGREHDRLITLNKRERCCVR